MKTFVTEKQIERLLDLWDSKTMDELSDELKMKPHTIAYLARSIRKAGHDLPKKRKVGLRDAMIKSVLFKKGLIKNVK